MTFCGKANEMMENQVLTCPVRDNSTHTTALTVIDEKYEISNDVLRSLVGESFDCGYFGSAERRDEYLSEILENYKINKSQEYRVFKVSELKQMPVGTIFHHLSNGRCWISEKANQRCMRFEKVPYPIDFLTDTEPWTKPMKSLYCPSELVCEPIMPVKFSS